AGTPGLGKGTFASISYAELLREGAQPEAEIAFPPAKPGGKAKTVKVKLPSRQSGDQFHGPVRVPEDAGDGVARITLSFRASRDVAIAPAVVEVPLASRR